MPLKDILVQLEDSEAADQRLRLAVALAKTHEAFLTGLYVAPPPPKPHEARAAWSFMADASLMSEASHREDKFYADMVEHVHAAANNWEKGFAKLTGKAGIETSWLVSEQALFDSLIQYGRFADVAIVGRSDDAGERVHGRDVANQLLLSVGHALMVVPPRKKLPVVGRRIMIAWDRSPVALRAVHNARSFLRMADHVKIIAVNIEPEYQGRTPGSGIIEHLARHGIKAVGQHIESREAKLSKTILSAAQEDNCDLLVMGAYGQAGLRERIIGGVTTNLLRETEIPVLLSH